MSTYAAEPVPAGVDPILAEYLMRQMIAIQNSVAGGDGSTVETVLAIPTNINPGKMVNVNVFNGDKSFNGLWACVSDHTGEYKWKRYLPDTRAP